MVKIFGIAGLVAALVLAVGLGSKGLGWDSRPASSLLPDHMQRMVIDYHPGQHQGNRYRTITDPSAMNSIVQAFNALKPAPKGPTNCAADFGQYLNITFKTQRGGVIRVHDALACHDSRVSTSSQVFFGHGKFSQKVLQLLFHG